MATVLLVATIAVGSVVFGYYVGTQSGSDNASPTPSPTVTPAPVPTSTPAWTSTPTPTSSANPTPTPTPSPSELTTQEKIRDSVMNFIKSNHPETSQFMTELVWTGGRVTPQNLVGAETLMYYSRGWNVTINYPVVPNPIYKIVADYSAIGISIPYRILWKGTWQKEVINETSYVFAQ